MCDDSFVNPGRTIRSRKYLLDKSTPSNNPPWTEIDSEQKGNLLIQDLWAQGTDFILDMRVMNMDAAYYIQQTPDKSLAVT